MSASLSCEIDSVLPDFRVEIDGEQRLVSLWGELDALTAPLALDGARMLSTFGDVTVDLHGVTYIGASGVNVVVELRNSLLESRHQLWLVGLTSRTRRAFVIAGLEALMPEPVTVVRR
jgi:anti-sigma B factor antagonist